VVSFTAVSAALVVDEELELELELEVTGGGADVAAGGVVDGAGGGVVEGAGAATVAAEGYASARSAIDRQDGPPRRRIGLQIDTYLRTGRLPPQRQHRHSSGRRSSAMNSHEWRY